MSNLIGNGSSLDTIVQENDANGRMKANSWYQAEVSMVRPDDFALLDGMNSGYWPGNGGLQTDAGGLYGDIQSSVWWELPEKISGQSSRFGILGVTRDVYGSPLPGVTLKLFRSSDDTKVDQQTSLIDGTYLLTTPFYPDAHYVVAYKTGSPDVEGTTVNTLIGG